MFSDKLQQFASAQQGIEVLSIHAPQDLKDSMYELRIKAFEQAFEAMFNHIEHPEMCKHTAAWCLKIIADYIATEGDC